MLTLNFSPFPVLESDRLSFRRLADTDAEMIFALRSNAETMKYIPRPLAKTIEDAIAHIALINENIDKNESVNWCITSKTNDSAIGIIGFYSIHTENFRAEIGYMILPSAEGNGYMTEAIDRVLRFGFDEMELHSVEAIIAPENIASERVLQKNGFVKEAHLIENEYYDGKFLDTVIYSLLARNFKTGHKKTATEDGFS